VAVPDGTTEIIEGDRLLFVTQSESVEALNRIFAEVLETETP
jgi:Trk K+ transport system NAD-binding subunit